MLPKSSIPEQLRPTPRTYWFQPYLSGLVAVLVVWLCLLALGYITGTVVGAFLAGLKATTN